MARNNILQNIWVLKEGAVIGLLSGLAIDFTIKYLNWTFISSPIQQWFGPLTETQLLLTVLYLSVSIGIIADAVYKPGK